MNHADYKSLAAQVSADIAQQRHRATTSSEPPAWHSDVPVTEESIPHQRTRQAAGMGGIRRDAPDATHTDTDEPDLHRNAPRPDPACLYGLIGEIARAAAQSTEANPYAVGLNLIAYMSAGVGRGPYLPVGNTWHHTNLFGLHIGRSGRGRKGDAASIVHRIDKAIRERGAPEALQVHRGGLSSREGLVLLIHDAYQDGKNEVPAIEDKRLMIFESEFVNVLHQGKREGNTLSAALRDAFDGVSIKPATKSNRIGATDPHISIVGACTPSELRSCLAARELTNGFANRFVMIWAERLKMIPFPQATSQTVVNGFADRISAVFRHAGANRWVDKDNQCIELSVDAQALYAHLYRTELNAEIGGPSIAPLLERRAPVLLRMAMIFALTDHLTVVEVRHIEAAHAWIRYWQESVLYIFASANEEAAAREVSDTAGKITAFLQSRDHATRWEISRDCLKGHISKGKLDAALDELLACTPPAIEIETVPRTDGRGSPTKLYKMAAKSAQPAKFLVDQGLGIGLRCAKSAKSAPADRADFADVGDATSHTSHATKSSQVIDSIGTSLTSHTSHGESNFAVTGSAALGPEDTDAEEF